MLKLARQGARAAFGLLDGGLPLGPPDRRRALERYREVACDYDRRTADGEPYRRRAVSALSLAPGDVVLDVGCGTGLNFAGIQARIGTGGRLVGIDQSAEMLARAHDRAERHGWRNVTLIQAPAEDADAVVQADAALLCATHDILRSAPALENVLAHVRCGGRVVAGGPKWAPWWRPDGASLDAYTWQLNRGYVTTFEGFDRPWSHLARLVPGLDVTELLLGAGYLAVGMRP